MTNTSLSQAAYDSAVRMHAAAAAIGEPGPMPRLEDYVHLDHAPAPTAPHPGLTIADYDAASAAPMAQTTRDTLDRMVDNLRSSGARRAGARGDTGGDS